MCFQLIRKFIIMALLLTTPFSSLALAPCGDVVVDTAGVLKDIPAIEAAAARLSQVSGADVRVRIEPNHGSSRTLDGHVENIADTTCAEWTNDDGSRYSNLIMFWVTMNRQIGVYFGDSWRQELDSAWIKIKDNKIIPSLRDGNFDRAFIRGIEETARVIEQAQQPTPQPVIVEREPVQIVDQREPTDWRPLGNVLMVVAGIGGVVLLFWFVIVPGWRTYDRNRGMRREALGMVASCYHAYELLNPRKARLEEVLGTLEKRSVTPEWANDSIFKGWHKTFVTIIESANGANTAVQMLESGPYEEAGTYEDYRVVRDQLNGQLKVLQEMAGQLTRLEEVIHSEQILASSIDAVAAEARAAYGRCKTVVDKTESEGFLVSSERRTLSEADALFERARSFQDEKLYARAQQTYAEAVIVAERAAETAEELPLWRDALRERWQALNTERQKLQQRLPTTRAALQSMVAQYARSSYEDIVGNGTEAENRLNQVPDMSKAINALLNEQSWAKAQIALEQAEAVLADAESLLDSIIKLKDNLDSLVGDTRDECEEAERSIAAARAFLATNPKYNSDNHQERLREADELVRQAKAQTVQDLPDYPVAFRAVARADDLADQVLLVAQQGKQRDEERRRRALRERREALAELDTVERYIHNHRSDVRATAKSHLRDAQSTADTLRRTEDTLIILELVKQLNERRNEAHRLAKQNFRKAEDARAAARLFSSSSSTFGGSSSSWGSSSSSFGGGSSSFGGGGGFGGGSSSW